MHDAYLSVAEALTHGGIGNEVKVKIQWVDSEQITFANVAEVLGDADGILVPGGFGQRGVEGKIEAIRYAREQKIHFWASAWGCSWLWWNMRGMCSAMPMRIPWNLIPQTQHPVIDLMPEQKDVVQLGGTMRLGKYPCKLEEGSKAAALYGEPLIEERHRHRFEVNNDFRKVLEEAGVCFSGKSPGRPDR